MHVIVHASCSGTPSHWNKYEKKIINKYSIGTCIKNNNNIYILACYHGIKNYEKILISKINSDKKIHVSCVSSIPEYDLALLKLNDIVDDYHFDSCYTMDDFEIKLDKYDIVVYGLMVNISNKITANIKKYDCVIDSIQIDSNISMLYPQMPYIIVDFKDFGTEDYRGMSGSLCFHSGIIGMLTNAEGNKLMFLHSSIILKFLKNFINNEIKTICCIPFKSRICTINERIYAHNINNDYGIIYGKDRIKLKDKIIIKFNDIMIQKNGNIFDDALNIDIPINTYIAIHYNDTDDIPIKIIDCNECKTIKIKPYDINKIAKIPYSNANKYINYNGLILVELTESIIIDLEKIMDINCECIDIFENDNYSNKGIKIIALIDLDRSMLDDNENNMFDDIGFPIVQNDDSTYSIPILQKIDRKQINNLDELITIIENKNIDRTLQFKTKRTINILIKNNKFSEFIYK